MVKSTSLASFGRVITLLSGCEAAKCSSPLILTNEIIVWSIWFVRTNSSTVQPTLSVYCTPSLRRQYDEVEYFDAFLISVTTNAQLEELFSCLTPSCGNKCCGFSGNVTAFTPNLVLVDLNLTWWEYIVDTMTSFGAAFTLHCINAINKSNELL